MGHGLPPALARRRQVEAEVSEKVGRWMRLESAIGKPVAEARGSVSAKAQRHFKKRRRVQSSWVVVVPGVPARGDTVLVARKDGTTTKLWVQRIIAPAH